MKLKELEIVNIGGVTNFVFNNIHSRMNIICGPNGIGKTTILECIAHIFINHRTNNLKKNVDAKEGSFTYKLENNEKIISERNVVNIYDPSAMFQFYGKVELSKKILYLKTNRLFNYENLSGISKDLPVDINNAAIKAMQGVDHINTKSWFIHRYVFSKDNNTLSPEQLSNFELAKSCFSILNKEYSFHSVEPNNLDILINTPSGVIVYEYLSSGFKSIISIVFGIIREIEFRFMKEKIFASRFDGIILIDEIELHLHPQWQGEVCDILKLLFPLAQFFVTTHSPHVIQTASKGTVIPLERFGTRIIRRKLSNQEYGFMGWTVEEILEDVMGMPDLRTKKYNQIKKRFDLALENKDKKEATEAYNELDKMLHPNYALRPVFKIQLDSLGE